VTGLLFEELNTGSRECPHLLVSSMDLFSKNGRIVKLGSDPSPPGGGAASQVIKLQISIIDAGRPSLRQL
jgi:hypothetical protein